MEKIQKYREDFAKIEAATEIDNFDELLRIFSRNEEKNFQMFKFVNLQSNEIEELEFEVAQLRDEEAKAEERTETSKDAFLVDMEENLKGVEFNLKDIEGRYRVHQKDARSVMGVIERIFETIECDREIVKEIGGSKTIS
jgi:coiled-coil domain-containing protein 63/114